MSFNLYETLNSTVGKAMVDQLPSFLGESKDKSESAVSSVLAALSGALVHKASTTDGANALHNMVSAPQIDSGLLGNLTGLFNGGNGSSSLATLGASLLPQLLGKTNASELAGHISQNTGVKSTSALSMLSMAAPLVLGVLKQQVSKDGLSAGGLASMLSGQSGFLKNLLPSWLTGAMGIGGMLLGAVSGTAGKAVDVAGKTAGAVGGAAVDTAKAGGGLIKKLLPWIILAALALFLLKWCGSAKTTAPAATPVASAPAAAAAPASSAAVTDPTKSPEVLALLAAVPGAALSMDGDKITLSGVTGDAAKGLLEKLKALFGSKFNLSLFDAKAATDSANQAGAAALAALTASSSPEDLVKALNLQVINFASGSAKISADNNNLLDKSAEAIKLISAAKLEVGGHTDNKGQASTNQKLSEARANAVMAYLVSKGAKAEQLTAKGYGQEKSVADNGTDDGRFKNRRIEYTLAK